MTKWTIHTDASYKDGVSTHCWKATNNYNNRRKQMEFKGYEQDSNKAELQTIESAMKWLNKNNIQKVNIYTDNKGNASMLNDVNCERSDIKYLQFLMKTLKVKVIWKSRETKGIAYADKKCRSMMRAVTIRKENMKLVI